MTNYGDKVRLLLEEVVFPCSISQGKLKLITNWKIKTTNECKVKMANSIKFFTIWTWIFHLLVWIQYYKQDCTENRNYFWYKINGWRWRDFVACDSSRHFIMQSKAIIPRFERFLLQRQGFEVFGFADSVFTPKKDSCSQRRPEINSTPSSISGTFQSGFVRI